MRSCFQLHGCMAYGNELKELEIIIMELATASLLDVNVFTTACIQFVACDQTTSSVV